VALKNPVIVRAYGFRGASLWLGIRAIASLLIVLSGADPFRLSAATISSVIFLSVIVCFIDTWRHHERALLGNLAVSMPALAALYVLPAVVGEAVLFAVGRLFT
jgi:hypothetical protein